MSGLDRDAAREAVKKWDADSDNAFDELLDALGGCVRPEPAQTIDRDVLVRYCEDHEPNNAEASADDILALLRSDRRDIVTMTVAEFELARERGYHEGLGEAGVILTRDDVSVLSEFLDDVILRAQKVSSWALWAYDLKRRLQAAS